MVEKHEKTDSAKKRTSRKKGLTTVHVYPDWCKGCGLCVAFCPGKVLELDATGKCSVVRQEDCVNCGFCELHCPDFAIVVETREEPGKSTSATRSEDKS